MAPTSRRLRAFKRWMISQSIECDDTVEITERPNEGFAVIAVSDLKEGQVISVIPKSACLTIKNCAAREMIEAAGLDGILGLEVAIMYEKSLGEESKWYGYLQLLPEEETVPLVWSQDEIDELLRGTEIYQTITEDKTLVPEDWKECIQPLLETESLKLNQEFFGLEQYFSVKTLIDSRAFTIDDYHGVGMVPLADLYNHRVGQANVHFTEVSPRGESDNDEEENSSSAGEEIVDVNQPTQDTAERGEALSSSGDNSDSNSEEGALSDDGRVFHMIMQQDVKSGDEVFNTYGNLGNASLLHRYGFAVEHNQFDIVNIDIDLATQWSSSQFSNRHTRARLSLWRKLGYSGYSIDNSECFEIYSDGTPQLELLTLLYILVLPHESYDKLNIAMSVPGDHDLGTVLQANDGDKNKEWHSEASVVTTNELLMTVVVCDALMWLADTRESFYGVESSLEDDQEELSKCCGDLSKRRLYYSLVLRSGERLILRKLRCMASAAVKSRKGKQSTSPRKKMKR